jgi:H+-translocating NAD(P) transhydrogenase subunit alpha
MLKIGVPRESTPGETRVALVPQALAPLIKAGLAIQVEAGAGVAASFPDEAYRAAGATIVTDTRTVFGSDIVLKVREPRRREDPAAHEAELMQGGAVLICFLNTAKDGDVADMLAARRVTTFAMERIPRISRAQNMDALSSMSTVAGYKAALLAAEALPRFFPLLMTAAGTIAPARVFVLGAGVAGLQAIATARRLGAVVEAFDVRPAVRDEVKSLGATFVAAEMASDANVGAGGYAKALTDEQERRMREVIATSVQNADVVIATANVPGRRAPVMVTSDMVQKMKPGSVIVDLAAESGGNCQLTEPGADIVRHGVTIRGPINLAASLPVHASQMYARNVCALLLHLIKAGELKLDFDDEITRGTCLTHDGRRLDTQPSSAPAVTVPA